MKAQDMKEKTQDTLDNVAENAKQVVSSVGDQMAASGKDWLNYVQTHPLQTALFGVLIYFGIKGIIK